MKKITLKIPLIHILSIILFYILIKVSMETEIQGKNEFAELLYGMTFFMRHDIITLVFGVVLIIPFLLLILSLFKKSVREYNYFLKVSYYRAILGPTGRRFLIAPTNKQKLGGLQLSHRIR